MTALPNPEATEPFGRYRFRGLDPKSVERWAMNYENENAALRLQISALEARAAKADLFAEDAVKEMVSLQEIVKRAETDQAIFVARQQMFREEAAQIVHDAWAEANIVRAQTQQLIDRTQAQLEAAKRTNAQHLAAMRATMMEEVEATIDRVCHAMVTECEEHHARIAALEDERARIVTGIEMCTANVLGAIAPLKQAPSHTHLPMGAREKSAAHAVHDATEALAMLVTTMQRSLETPAADVGWSGLDETHPTTLEESEVSR